MFGLGTHGIKPNLKLFLVDIKSFAKESKLKIDDFTDTGWRIIWWDSA